MTTDPITQVETVLIARIAELLGATVRKVDSLPGDLDEEILKKMLIAAPGVYVSFGGGSRQGSRHQAEILSRWTVFVITGHASGQAARRTGDLVQVGAYRLVSQLCGALDGWTIPDVGTLELADVRNLFTGAIDRQGCTLYGAAFTLPLSFPPEIDPADLADFLTFHADYDLAPPDGTVDAKDVVTLPQQGL